ncbi:phosphoribosylglycinamide formyltransferase [Paucilactobacillus hokkaidonensis JCM 18461]|uniref:Phosphoribosylglycinamide formyltransferase n=2 Tax=Paucilactobacillus hokkaidonensis TaxID=1193095 RepID=A0A0A1GXJ9_9LACO|nr:phosphoribosylglycinamide formyltransferase [Paucilactobacillus hokkaidonensis]KRO10636.1 phosphoribosylglycinamide formyltransferase [Paucilactobacillus hokkaidonensis]BAP85628.1 phosphoribosylglycinamide formyltransferase [Paucilactobacillus hokkaidonensis JCM 18461]
MIKIAVFASGTGTNFVALAQHIKHHRLPIQITHLICDQPQATVITRAREFKVPVWVHQLKEFKDKTEYEQTILQCLQEDQVQLIVLAGYMRIVTNTLLNAYPRAILNIHPALLPAFPGRHGIEDALLAGVKITGVTIHYVDAGVDSGPIIAQQPVKVLPHDDLASLANRIHQVEHQLYFDSLCQVLQDKKLLK